MKLPERSEPVYIPLILRQGNQEVQVPALYNTGAVCSTIHPEIVKDGGLHDKDSDFKAGLVNADGTYGVGGTVTRQVNAKASDRRKSRRSVATGPGSHGGFASVVLRVWLGDA